MSGETDGELNPNQQACLRLLEIVKAQVVQGNIGTLGIITVGVAGAGTALAGSDAGGLMIGIEKLKLNIMANINGEQQAPRQRPAILRPGRQIS